MLAYAHKKDNETNATNHKPAGIGKVVVVESNARWHGTPATKWRVWRTRVRHHRPRHCMHAAAVARTARHTRRRQVGIQKSRRTSRRITTACRR